MDSRFLDSFVMVVDIGSIAETARRLNITAAGVAQRIRALETEIGTRLVVRSGQRVRPTEAGLAILARSRSILSDLRDLKPMAIAIDLQEYCAWARQGRQPPDFCQAFWPC